jgi:hypothetical protein
VLAPLLLAACAALASRLPLRFAALLALYVAAAALRAFGWMRAAGPWPRAALWVLRLLAGLAVLAEPA